MENRVREVKAIALQKLENYDYFPATGSFMKNRFLQQVEDTDIREIVFEVNRECNADKLYFRYNEADDKFYRILLDFRDEKILKKDTAEGCSEPFCHDKIMTVETFLRLLGEHYEPMAVYTAKELQNRFRGTYRVAAEPKKT